MNILDKLFSTSYPLDTFYERKLKLPLNKSFFLYGARGVGKSTLIFNYMNSLPKNSYLYIDCQDPIFILEELDSTALSNFLKEEKIKTLILDHYFEGFLEDIPKVEQLIIASKDNLDINLPKYHLFPLNFEEFLNFSKNPLNLSSAFNSYTKKGSLPKFAKAININSAHKEFFFEKFETQEGKVMLILALFQAKVTTPHQIYQIAKEYFKISKDWLYKTIKNFTNEGIIYQIPTLQKGFGKKVILYDFAFSNYLNKYQTFIATLDSIVAMALIKHRFEILCTTNPLGYIIKDTNSFVVVSPFDSQESFWLKAQNNFGFYSKLNIDEITVVTVSNQYSFKIKNITFNAIPFYEWSIGVG